MKSRLLIILTIVFITNLICKAQTPILWSTTSDGGSNSYGIILNYNVTTSLETDLYNFGKGNDGKMPSGSLLLASNGLFYGMTQAGGNYGNSVDGGTIFSFNILTGKDSLLYSFGNGKDGLDPYGSLVQASNGLLYGMTSYGGAKDSGTIFSFNISTGNETILHSFSNKNDGYYGFGSLIQASNGLLYGMTYYGGTTGTGVIFSYNISTGTETVVHNFGNSSDGQNPTGSLIQASDGLLYGMTYEGGIGEGTIFNYNTSTGKEKVLHNFCYFCSNDGWYPNNSLIQASDGILYGLTNFGGAYNTPGGGGVLFSYNISTGVETDLHDFGNGNDGMYPSKNALFEASDGRLYGTTSKGGTYKDGTIFSYNISNETETLIYNFGSGTDGIDPLSNLIEYDPVSVSPANAIICQGDSIKIIAHGPAETYSWSPSTGLNATTGDSVIANPLITTTYTVQAITGSGNYVAKLIVKVNPNPAITLNTPVTICNGQNVLLTANGDSAYSWSPSIGLNKSTGDSIVANPTLSTTYTVTGTNGDGCKSSSNGIVKVNPNPQVTINAQFPICSGLSISLIVNGAANYKWTPSSGLNSTNGDSVIANPTVTTIYFISCTDTLGCTSLITDTVTVNPNPILSLKTLSPLCNGKSITLVVQGASSYRWSPSQYLSDTTGGMVLFTPTDTTKYIYSIVGTDSLGCSSIVFDTLFVNAIPLKPNLRWFNDTIISNAKQGNQWYVDGDSVYGATQPIYVITFGECFWSKVTDSITGCNVQSDTICLEGINHISSINTKLLIYPNPTSGQFIVKLPAIQTNYSIEIYNVLGEKVYQSILNDSQNTINLNSQPDGMYFVYLKSDEGVEVGKVLLTR